MTVRRHFVDSCANILVYLPIDGNVSSYKPFRKNAKIRFSHVGCKCQKMIVFCAIKTGNNPEDRYDRPMRSCYRRGKQIKGFTVAFS